MKKRSILYYLLIILPFLIAIGFSTWVIIYEFSFGPNKQESTLSSYFGTEQEGTFCNEELFPVQKNGDKIELERITYYYKDYGADDSKYDEGGPIDSGEYNIKIIVTSEDGTSSEECVIKYTVKPRKVTSNIAEMDYSSTDGNYTDFVNNKRNYLKFYGEDGSVDKFFTDGSYDILAMHNGYYYYGDLDSIKDCDTNLLVEPEVADTLVGSTYLLQIELNSDNFLLKDCISNEYTSTPRVMFKYKTVESNGKICTIEDAILNSSYDISLLGIDSNDNTYIETCFSKILDTKSYTISDSRKLLLPYTNSTSNFERTYNNSLTGIYSTLMIPDGITITLTENSKSSIIVGSIIDQAGTVERHSVLMNNGTINVYKSCQLGAYGYVKGTGLINVFNEAEAVDVFRLYDWPGAGSALTLKGANAFPVKEWSVYNISCKTRVYKGGLYNSISYIVALSGLTKIKVDDIYIIGNDNTNNCLFKPSSSSIESDYVEKSATITNDGYNVSNQVKTTMNNVTIHGDYIDASVKVNASGYAFQTSTSMAVPINYYNITISENSKLVLAASSYIFLSERTKINVKKNATLDINGSAYLAMLNNSCLIMDEQGSTLGGTGTFGGKIVVNAEKSVLKIKNYDKYTTDDVPVILKTGSETYANQESIAKGNVKVGNEYKTNQTFTDSYLYISEAYGSSYYYVGASEDEYNTYRIVYNTNGGDSLESDVIPSFDSTYTVTLDSLQVPHKDYYTLVSWYTDENCTEGNEFTGTTLTASNATLNLYAKWKYKEYSFSYMVAYEDSNNNNYLEYLDNNTVLSNLNGKFTYETLQNGDLTISTTATYGDKTFYGWYVGFDEANGILVGNTFKLSYLEKIVAESDVNEIPLYAVFKDYEEYTINFVDGTGSSLSFSAQTNVINGNTINWPGMDFYKDSTQKYYCLGWYLDSELSGTKVDGYTSFDETLFEKFADDKNVINVYGNFTEKRSIVYKNDDEVLTTKYYLSLEDISTIGEKNFEQFVSYTPQKEIAGYTYSNWIDSKGNTYAFDGVTISTFSDKVKELQLNKSPIPYTLTINNSNAKVTVDDVTKTGTVIVYIYNTVVISVTGKDGGLFSSGASVSATINYNGTSSTITGEGGGAFFDGGKTASKTITNITGDITIS